MKKIFILLASMIVALASDYPATLAVTDNKQGAFLLSWTDTATLETGWEVQVLFTKPRYHRSPQDWTTKAILPPDSTSATIPYALKGEYWLRVKPVGTSNPWSNIVIVLIK